MSDRNNSYQHILKSIGIFGGSQFVQITAGVARTKIIALLLGSVGFGIIGVFQNVIQIFSTIGMLGYDTGSVREIALANTSGSNERLRQIVSVVRYWFLGIALMAMTLTLLFCYPISRWAFSNTSYAIPIAFLSLSVLFGILSRGNIVVLQGLNKVGDMAKATIWGNIFAVVASVPLYFLFGLKGIVPSLILSTFIQFVVAVKYRKKLQISPTKISVSTAFRQGKKTLKFGIAIMISAVVSTLTLFMMRTLIIDRIGLSGAGFFQAVWTITNTYLLMVLSSMSADYFPRLSAVSENDAKIRESVDKQTYIVMLIVTPIITGMLVFGKYVLWILYSGEFLVAQELLNWQLLGTFFKVASWPMAFILLAKGKGRLYIFSEISFFAVYYLATYFLFPKYGLNAAGIGYLMAYGYYVAIIMIYAIFLSSYIWKDKVLQVIILSTLLVLAAFLISYFFANNAMIIGIIIFTISIILSYFEIKKHINLKQMIQKRTNQKK